MKAVDTMSMLLGFVAIVLVMAMWVVFRVLSASIGKTPWAALRDPFRLPEPPPAPSEDPMPPALASETAEAGRLTGPVTDRPLVGGPGTSPS